MSKCRAAIKAVASYLPARTLTNEQLVHEFGEGDAAQILQRVGIAERRIAADGECASDLAVGAALQLFATGACRPEEIDFLLLCTQSPDYFLPTTACLIQQRLGLPTTCGALDLNQGCSGYLYGLAVAKGLLETGAARNVLFLTADTYTRFINPRDRTARILFGDGAAATLVGMVQSEVEMIGPFVFGTDGRGEKEIIVPAGGLRQPLDAAALAEKQDAQGNWRSASNFYMNGGEVFNFSLKTVPVTVEQLLAKTGLTIADVDYFIPHQASKFMLERLRDKIKIPAEKFHIDLELTANTVSSTIPIAFEGAKNNSRIKSGHRIALIGFGVGYSWSAAMIQVV